ncbi:replicative DNA helicase [Candidatus Proelusimicrobium excrementi]|uniref:replicative DNA helicase n=1 Tax=Candidatus Proelusimicrobium excrementi TaxID=3416222 RepID=UPI003CA98714|nr:replicative DNA helicase [Elusimicrobiaceae bacterium]
MAINDKLPPQALDAEMAVLGSMMIEAEALERAFDILKPEHFYKNAHQKIFNAMASLMAKNQAVDLITITEELKRQGFLAEIGGERYLSELMGKVSTAAHVEHYAKMVYEAALVRELINISTSTVEECYKNPDDPTSLIDEAQGKLFKLNQQRELKGFVSSKELSGEVMQMIEKLIVDKNPIKGVPTGFTKFDLKTGGLRKSDLIILAARPSQGKTAMALNIAHYAAVHAKVPVAIFSLEMSRHSIYQRMVCSAAMADLHQVSTGMFKKERWRELAREIQRLGEAPMFIDDTPALTITDIRVRSRRLASELKKQGKELGLIMIDYIGLIRGGGKKAESRQQEVSEISRMLKELARNLEVPVLALSQLNRKTEDKTRTSNRPQLSDLRESGSIEQDADVVALIHREGYYKRDDPSLERDATLIIAKQRNGPVGDVKLNWYSEYTLFANPAPENVEVAPEAAPV